MTSFRTFLRDELLKRTKKNPSYSLRAFAASLGMDASTFSKILKGKRPIGKKTIEQIGKKMGLSDQDISAYQRATKEIDEETQLQQHYLTLAADQFTIIKDWYHFAIRSLISTNGFKPDRRWIAKVLELSVKEVDEAVERLLRVGLITVDKNGQWKSTGSLSNLGKGETHNHFYKQHLRKALRAMDEVPENRTNYSAMTFTMNSKKMEEACARIVRFRRNLANFLAEGEECDEVYSLTVALFPLSHIYKTSPPKGRK
ncbi:hypothetical protein AZI86_16985 [Bdellovibrio bacteriovorus]|uniref:HTH cro/C1-type domain-containing protein n=1 Tax=Bdellovibrio bacteriovorus TaxID=959 RepID=A0A150WE65_BDEBC|nr:TIGR02147 family protein [Bdellovibrio bacteriovorus]KYG61408.1 hypothetical protein AZI86_16985 [Bdellovibrio bacteriovorus]